MSPAKQVGLPRPRDSRLAQTGNIASRPLKFAQVSSQFRGDAEGLVDLLIAASQMKPQAIPQLEGRELVKWADDSCCSGSALLDMPLEISSNRCVAADRVSAEPGSAMGLAPDSDLFSTAVRLLAC